MGAEDGKNSMLKIVLTNVIVSVITALVLGSLAWIYTESSGLVKKLKSIDSIEKRLVSLETNNASLNSSIKSLEDTINNLKDGIIKSNMKVEITYPNNNAPLKGDTRIRGSAKGLSKEYSVWVVTETDKYYPMNREATIDIHGQWTSHVYFGPSKQYLIHAVIADQEANKGFLAYARQVKETKDYTGLDNLPNGSIIGHTIEVTIK